MGQHSSAAAWPLCRTELGSARLHGSHHRFRLVRISVECLVKSAALAGLTALLRWISYRTCALLIGQLVVVCLPHQSHDVREFAVLRQADLCRPVAAVTSVPHVPSESFFWWRASTRMFRMDRMKRAGFVPGPSSGESGGQKERNAQDSEDRGECDSPVPHAGLGMY